MLTPLLDELIRYSRKPKIPFHMPAHSFGRAVYPVYNKFLGRNVFKIDLTELDNLDNLSNPEGIIKHTQDRIADIFGAKNSYMLVNGSTSGIVALILSVVKNDEKILVSRNCHRSVINGIILSGAYPVWILPQWISEYQLYGKVEPECIEEYLKKDNKIKAVILTNPTYEGIISDIESISSICKKYNVPLIVDEAHGGHWNFSDQLPETALKSGSNAVVQSMHKTCGSLTQSSVLHLNYNSKISQDLLEENLRLVQTTSPSYLLMSSLEASIVYMNSDQGRNNLRKNVDMSIKLHEDLNNIDNVKTIFFDSGISIDPTKIFITIKNLSGNSFADMLENKYNIAIESLNNIGILLLITIGNTKKDLKTLLNSVKEISKMYNFEDIKQVNQLKYPEMSMKPRNAFYYPVATKIKIADAIGKISKYPIIKYPPGSCILFPGEIIQEYHLEHFNETDLIDVI